MANKKGMTVFEILMVAVMIAVIAGFALPNYSRGVRKHKERNAVQNLYSLHAAHLMYRSHNNQFWTSASDPESNLATINATLGTNVIPNGVTYSYDRVGGPPPTSYSFIANWTESGTQTQIRLTDTLNRTFVAPCCVTPPTTMCLTLAAC